MDNENEFQADLQQDLDAENAAIPAIQATCETADSVKAFNCQREEQCDDCWMVDHLKECAGCDHYDHPTKI